MLPLTYFYCLFFGVCISMICGETVQKGCSCFIQYSPDWLMMFRRGMAEGVDDPVAVRPVYSAYYRAFLYYYCVWFCWGVLISLLLCVPSWWPTRRTMTGRPIPLLLLLTGGGKPPVIIDRATGHWLCVLCEILESWCNQHAGSGIEYTH